MIKHLHDTGQRIGWSKTYLRKIKEFEEKEGLGVYVRKGGNLKTIPLVYAAWYRCKKDVMSHILKVMVEHHGYSTEFAERVQFGMVTSLFDPDADRWRKTTLPQVQELAQMEPSGTLRVLNSYNGFHDELPIYYALWGEARVEVVEWMCETGGIDRVMEWRDENGWTLLHYCSKWNRPRVIPYLLSVFGTDFALIRNDSGRIAIEYAEKEGKEKHAVIDVLMNPKETLVHYMEEHH